MWQAAERDPVTGRVAADPQRFPSGIPALVSYAADR
jgi:hypothetical protein